MSATPRRRPTAGSGRLLVWEKTDVTSYRLKGQSALHSFSEGVVNEFETRIPVQGLARLGLRLEEDESPASSFTTGVGGDVVIHNGVGAASVATGDIVEMTTVHGTETRLNVAATIEPDLDGDGFGDETQDGCTLRRPPEFRNLERLEG